jgi:hypothetical protein
MLIVRLIAGMLCAAGAAVGAQFGIAAVLGADGPGAMLETVSEEASVEGVTEEAMAEETEAEVVEEEPVYDDRLPLPYEDGQAAAFLAGALEGSEPQFIWQADSRVDLGALAADVAAPESGGQASCQSSHVALSCSLERADGYGFSFGLQGLDGDWVVVPNSVRQLDNS